MRPLSLVALILLMVSVAAAGTTQHMHHSHGTHEITNYNMPPEVTLEIFKDAKSGYNIHLKTKNFRFAPELVNTSPMEGSGHVHLYVNKKKYRLYGPWFHLPKIPKGEVTIHVELCANTHDVLTVHNKRVEDKRLITAKGNIVTP